MSESNQNTGHAHTSNRFGRNLFWLFLFAMLLRVIGVNYGYFHPDERINDGAKALAGQLVPDQLFYPPFLNYINAVVFGLLYAFGRLIPLWQTTAEFRAQYFADPTVFYLAARFATAMFGACLAPLFYLISRQIGIPTRGALLAGLLGAVLPISVYLSHIAKSDVGLTSAMILVFLMMLKRHQTQENLWADILIGVSVTLALSFKQSYIFVFAPLLMVHATLLLRATTVRILLKSFFLSTLATLALWPILNIGLLLDFQSFIDFQRIQTVMSIREGITFLQSAELWFEAVQHSVSGVNPLITVLAVLFPIYLALPICRLQQKPLLFGFWLAVTIATLLVLKVAGERQPVNLWLPYFVSMQLFAVLLLGDLVCASNRFIKAIGFGLAILALGLSTLGSGEVIRQALVTPNANAVDKLIKSRFPDRKILTAIPLDLPQHDDAIASEYARIKRLAIKYNVALPEVSDERLAPKIAVNPIYFSMIPMVMGGLEFADDAAVEGFVKAHTWPAQAEEWQLSYWTEQGYDVFIVAALDDYLASSAPKLFQRFYGEMTRTCDLVKEFKAQKPIFFEDNISVFECR